MEDQPGEINPDHMIGVFGSGQAEPQGQQWRLAYDVGKTLAELGYAIANGGYGGTMEASAKGAVEAGGGVVGVTCKAWKSQANKYVSRTVVTAHLPERIATLIKLGRAGYVVLPGATGTLAELAWVWEMCFKGFISARPIVCMGQFWRPLVDMMSEIRPSGAEFVALAGGPEELAGHFPAV